MRGVEVPLVVTHADAAGEAIWFGSVADAGADAWPALRDAADPHLPELLAEAARGAPDFLFSFYYRHMLRRRGSQLRRAAPSTCTARCCRSTAAARR